MDKYPFNQLITPIRKPVKRVGAENYLLYTLLSFATSVASTRLFLELTGYPQLGGSELHIAHVLWGGLLLFISSLLPLIFANRWVYIIGALCAGVGVGLFIDEVGKFITQSNDYFYPAAAPIIYAFFLITVMVYFQVRKSPIRDARSELYRALDAIEEILDHDLDEREHGDLKERLKFVEENADHPDLARLAVALMSFVDSDAVYTSPKTTTIWMRWKEALQTFEERWVSQLRLRAILTGCMLALGFVAMTELAHFAWALREPDHLQSLVTELVVTSQISNSSGMGWFFARLILEVIAGLVLLAASILFMIGEDRYGVQIGAFGLLLSLTTVNLFVFYFEQFSTIILATIQFLTLLGVIHYRNRYVTSQDDSDVSY